MEEEYDVCSGELGFGRDRGECATGVMVLPLWPDTLVREALRLVVCGEWCCMEERGW